MYKSLKGKQLVQPIQKESDARHYVTNWELVMQLTIILNTSQCMQPSNS